MNKWNKYYTEKYHPETIDQSSQENKTPVVDTNAIVCLISTQPIIGTNFDEAAVMKNFYTVNSGNATEEEIEKTKEMIEKLPEGAYRNALVEGMAKWDEYYLEKYHPEIIAQRKEEEKKPKIDSETIRRLKPYTSTKEENMALEHFNTINSGTATEEEIKAANELIERLPSTLYQAGLKDAMNKWNKYYTEKYHPVKTNANFTNIAKPIIDMDTIRNLKPQHSPYINNDNLEAFTSFRTINNGNATAEELEAAKEIIKKLPEGAYRNALTEGMEKWDKYYAQKALIAKDKPKLDMDNLKQLTKQFSDETAEIRDQFKIVTSGNATEADIRKMDELIRQVKDDDYDYYLDLKDEMKNWEPYYTEKFQKGNSQSTYYQQIIDLSKEGKIPDSAALSSILESAKNSDQVSKEELDTINQLFEISQKYTDIQKQGLPDYRQQMYENLEKHDQKLKELMRNAQGSKEEVEDNLRKLVEPLTYDLDENIKQFEKKLAQINDPDQRDKVVAEANRGIGKNIPADAYEKSWENQLHKNIEAKDNIESNIKNVVDLYEKVQNKDYPNSKKEEPEEKDPDLPKSIFKLDDEEADYLTGINAKLRKKVADLKNKGVFKKVLGWIKDHPVKTAALLATTGLIGTVTIFGVNAFNNNKSADDNMEQTKITQEAAEDTATQTPVETAVEEAMQEEVAENSTIDNNELANQVLSDEQSRIATGSDAVYQDMYSAMNEQNKLYAQSSDTQNIWQNTNVEAGKMYQVDENGVLSELHGADDIIQAGNEGKTIISTWQNEDGTLGRSVITPNEFDQSMESAKTR